MPRPTKKSKTCPKCGQADESVLGVYLRYKNRYYRTGWYCGKCKTYWYD